MLALMKLQVFTAMLAVVAIHQAAAPQAAESKTDVASPDVAGILGKMEERNSVRNDALHSYAVDRVYSIENKRFKKTAKVNATMLFVAPGEKLFEVTSATGSGFLRKTVLNRMIETERENAAPAMKERTSISRDNYDFSFARNEVVGGRPQYVLRAKPKRKDQLLFDGTIWVDSEDYAVTRVEAAPAKRPSFWTRKIRIVHEYARVGDFWLPLRNRSSSSVFLFGETTTAIDYTDYRVNRPELEEKAAALRKLGTRLEVQIDAKDK